ncbi:MAG: hypothetical protein JRI68_11365 [Deltaproteobacteria bacterium]|nr:hypothetical protein [Deltaproteobacteria bacterium]
MSRALGWIVAVAIVLHVSSAWADVAGPPSPYHVCNSLAEGDNCYADEFPDCYCRLRPPEDCSQYDPGCMICLRLAADGSPEGAICESEWDEESDDDDDDRDGGCNLRIGQPTDAKGIVLLALIAMIGYVSLRRGRSSGPPQDDDEL